MSRRWAAQRDSLLLTARLVALEVTVAVTVAALCLVVVVVGVYLFPWCVRAVRAQAVGIAQIHARRTGIELRVPTVPEVDQRGFAGHVKRTLVLLSGRDTWRLLLWAFLDSYVGIVLATAPLGLVVWGLRGVILLPALYLWLRVVWTDWYFFLVTSPSQLPLAAAIAAAIAVAGFSTGPWWLRLHGRWEALFLGAEAAGLRERVDALKTSRADARQDAAAELRRIEQEVHDGTQSQLVSIGMKLGTAEALLDDEPQRARDLIAQAREDSSAALTELRDLMRGIRPPVLADRGLGPALEALALDATITVTTRIALADRFDESLESTVYFAARELIANAIKHSGASHVMVDASTDGRLVTVRVEDDGRGGATLVPGHGLDGVRRRLTVFDGALTVQSPAGGPTVVRIEVPCEL
jgi:signal transduction histidine kinase